MPALRTLRPKAIIGMVHLPALPGAPQNRNSMGEILAAAERDSRALLDGGADALLIENMHDRPYRKGFAGPETVAVMTAVAARIRSLTNLPVGIQILAAANCEALAVALAADLDFVRVEGFVFGHLADEGYIDSCAAELLRFRRQIGAGHVRIFADIKKKHSSHSITADTSIAETARAAEFFLADGLIVTGVATGCAASENDVRLVKAATTLPVLVGSGITAENIAGFLLLADAVIVGSSVKESGDWTRPVDAGRMAALVRAAGAFGCATKK